MDDCLADAYKRTGVAHIFAVSGLHVGFVAGIFAFLLSENCVSKAYYPFCDNCSCFVLRLVMRFFTVGRARGRHDLLSVFFLTQ